MSKKILIVKILIVDDEPDIVMVLEQRLKASGYQVEKAGSGQEALKKAKEEKPDLIIMDIVMPDMDGRRLADQALKLRPKLKVLFTTGYTRNAVVHHGVVDAGVHLLGKPYSLDQLAAKVRAVLDESD